MVPAERSWFNIANRPFPRLPNSESSPAEPEGEEEEDEVEEGGEVEEMIVPLEGHHLEVFLERIEFKNGETIEVKRLVHQQGK